MARLGFAGLGELGSAKYGMHHGDHVFSSMPVQLDALLCSICWCRNLKVLEANDNYLEKLPAKLGDMKARKLLRQDEISDRILLQTNCRDAGWQV